MLVVVQAGHAGRTSGATGAPGEQEFTVKARRATTVALRAIGVDVREINADEPDSSYKGDAFFAIHADGSSNPNVTGASVGYQTTEGGRLAAAWRRWYVQLGWNGGFHPDNYTDALGGYYGVRRAVRAGNRHACIVEAGFITSPADRARMTPERVGRAIAAAVAEIFNIKGADDMDVDDIQPGGEARPVFKGLIIGSVLEGLREPHEDDDKNVVGVLREPFKNLLREVLDER